MLLGRIGGRALWRLTDNEPGGTIGTVLSTSTPPDQKTNTVREFIMFN